MKGRLTTWRARLPVVGVVVACVAAVCVAITGAANPLNVMQFQLPGHWVFNASLQLVAHIDGATAQVDARGGVPGDPGAQVVAGETSGFVVGNSRIIRFGKSNLTVEGTTNPPVSNEQPAPVNAGGDVYLVYRQAGKVMRLGSAPAVIPLGGPVGDPVATGDGTLWVPRTGAGLLCKLPSGGKAFSCPVLLPQGHQGALTLVNDRPVFVDLTADRLHPVQDDGLGQGRGLGVDAPDGAKLASTDVSGRVVILHGSKMHLVDSGLDQSRPAEAPRTVELSDGDYAGPVSNGSVVAVMDRKSNTLTTYDSKGQPKKSATMPKQSGDPRLTRGEDNRVYVEGGDGDHVLVVDDDGEVTGVSVSGEAGYKNRPDAQPPATEPPPGGGAPPTRQEPQQPQQPRQQQPQQQPRQQQPKQQPPQVPPTPPGAPGRVSASAGNGAATVSWTPAPANRSPIARYTITWPGGSITAAAGARSATINGLANGTAYVFTVSATNGVGTGPGVSSNPVTPVAPVPAVTPAAAPGNVQVTYDAPSRDALLTWAAPNMNGGAFLHYVVSVTGVPEKTVSGTNALWDEIPTSGTLTFTVRAVTRAPDGRQLVGAPATTTAQAAGGAPRVRLSRGPATSQWCGELPGCAWMHVELIDFPPNKDIFVDPDSTESDYTNPGHTFRTDASGHAVGDEFAYAGVGETVHVNAHLNGKLIRSNDVKWVAG